MDEEDQESFDDDAVDGLGISGWKMVTNLTCALVDLYDQKGLYISNKQANNILKLVENLSEFDKKRTVFPKREVRVGTKGRFSRNR